MKIRIAKIEPRSLVDGPGERAVVFLQGCTLACPGCQNRHLWDGQGGSEQEVMDVAITLAGLARFKQVTISGGEPFQQPAALAELVYWLRLQMPAAGIIIYTGYTWEQLFDHRHPARPYLQEILDRTDVVVDGTFQHDRDDDLVQWRGSRNQRPIDVWASLTGTELVMLDWDAPRVIIDEAGDLVLPAGLADEFEEIGEVGASRMCGQTRPVGRAA